MFIMLWQFYVYRNYLIIIYPLKFKYKIIVNNFDRFWHAFYDFINQPKWLIMCAAIVGGFIQIFISTI